MTELYQILPEVRLFETLTKCILKLDKGVPARMIQLIENRGPGGQPSGASGFSGALGKHLGNMKRPLILGNTLCQLSVRFDFE